MKTLLAVFLAMPPLPAMAGDACDAQLPGTLKAQVERAFPAFRAPVVSDNLQEDVEWNLKQNGTGCLGIAKADFDGNGSTDVVLGLTARKGPAGVVLVALSRGKKEWEFKKLDAWPEGRSRLYVSAEKPGVFVRTGALEGPLEPGEVSPLKCAHAAAVFGVTESTGVAYCYKEGTWQHVRVAD